MDSRLVTVLGILANMGAPVPKRAEQYAGRRYLDRKQAAEYIGMSDFWLERHAGSDEAPRHVKHGRKAWYPRPELDAWLAKRSVSKRTPAAAVSEADVETRRFVEPADQMLDTLWQDTWGEKVGEACDGFEGWCARFLGSLTPEQREMLGQIAKGLPHPK